ncbi:LAGLIDADG family homing endonuclease [Ekhidna sp.]|uniref:LAGLIDADG family homing endonuclease n=1 Tax=Ekhidna sp. TaxID=2608089 RepID=UPI003CCC4392
MNWGYISGFFDADGSIQLNKIHKNQLPSPVITFHNNEKIILERIERFINEKLSVKGAIVTKKKKGFKDQYELRYSYFSKVLLLVDKLDFQHPKKMKRIKFVRNYKLLSKRNGKYSEVDLLNIESLLKQWE